MLYLITGGSGSGKSEYAERLAVCRYARTGRGGGLHYIATMRPFDEECLQRIERHRHMRREKGFSTIECQEQLERVRAGASDVLLLECMSNLLANEMYGEEGRIRGRGDEAFEQAEEAIIKPVLRLAEQADCVVVVSNEVFSDGAEYEEETQSYVRLLGWINAALARRADSAVEVVCSIPVCLKGEMPC